MPSDTIPEGLRIVDLAAAAGIELRLLGGVAVVLHCDRIDPARPHREIADVDAVVRRDDARELSRLLLESGYEAEKRFNALHGSSRMIFHGPAGKLDLFVGAFEMCHRIELDSRLSLDSPTLPVADLVLTKLQVVELSEKDAHDLALLLAEHEVSAGPGDSIDGDYLGRLLADDWCLWRTVTGTLATLRDRHPETATRIDSLERAVEGAPRSRRYRLRARVGERKRWYQLPEEVAG